MNDSPPQPRAPTVRQLTLAERIDDVILRELGVNENELTPNARLTEDLGADSLDVVELAITLEEEFDIPVIDDGVVDKWRTVKDVHCYIERAAGAKKKR